MSGELSSLYQMGLRHQCRRLSDFYPGLSHNMLIDLHLGSYDGDMLSDLVSSVSWYIG